MSSKADQQAKNPFWFSEYFLMPRPMGKKAASLRELKQHLPDMPESVLLFHLWENRLTLTQTVVEYPNDFALWAATSLHDVKLAEVLSSVDPFDYKNLAEMREAMVDMLEDYTGELSHNPEVRPGYEFHFCEGSAVVMPSGISAWTLRQLCKGLRTVGLDSVYFHFVEARRRLADRKKDDFVRWIEDNFDLPALVEAIRSIDVYFYTLKEARDTLLALIMEHAGENCGQPE